MIEIEREILEKLAPENGLGDDYNDCTLCEDYHWENVPEEKKKPGRIRYIVHEDNCPWLIARKLLGDELYT